MTHRVKHHQIDFHKGTEKQLASWYGFKVPQSMSELTELRILATRLRIHNPRGMTEETAAYSERLAEMIVAKKRSHLDEFDTAIEVDKWLWGPLRRGSLPPKADSIGVPE